MESARDRAASSMARLQGAWPAPVALQFEGVSSFYDLPACFLPAFPGVREADVDALFVFSRLFASAILLQDGLLDGDCSPADVPLATMRVMAIHAEATRVLVELFPPRAAFWDRYHSYLAEHARAFVQEQRYGHGGPLRCMGEREALAIASDKHGTVKTIVAALVELTGREELLAPLCAAVEGMGIGMQMADDVEDWEKDMRRGRASLLLARTLGDWPGALDEAAWREARTRVARRVYYRGHARHVLELGIEALDRAEAAKRLVGDVPFFERTERIRRRCRTKRDAIAEAVSAQVAAARVAQARE
jgi:hypothetical protein